MGHRASLVVIAGSKHELYYSQWHASSLDGDLFWGPDHATAFARSQARQESPAQLLVDAWAEGGAVIDHGQRVVLWYGGDEIRFDVPRRRMHLSLMRGLWPNWSVRWAAEGIADIADYLNIPRRSVLSIAPEADQDPSWVFQPPQDPSWLATVITSSRGGATGLITTDCSVVELLSQGHALLDALKSHQLKDSLDWTSLTSEFPTGGIHVDWNAREISYWLAEDAPGLTERTKMAFPGWTSTNWGDCYEAQMELCAGRLQLPIPNSRVLLSTLKSYLLEGQFSRTEPVSSIVNRMEDDDGIITPQQARLTDIAPPPSERERLLTSVLPPPAIP